MTIRHLPNRTTPAKWVLDCGLVLGKRRQLFFETEGAAKAAMRAQEKDRRDVGDQWAGLTSKERSRSVEILAAIKAADLTLETVWESFLESKRQQPKTRATVAEAIRQTLDAKRAQQLRPEYLKQLEVSFNGFARGQEARMIDTFTTAELRQWLIASGGKPNTYKSRLERIKTLFAFSKKLGFILEDPAAPIEKPTVEMGTPHIFDNGQVASLLEITRTRHPEMLPYMVLGLFAGLRPAEAARLTWNDIDLSAAVVSVNANVSKVRSRRIVDLHPTAVAWLQACTPGLPAAPVTPKSIEYRMERIRDGMGLQRWPQDVLRHTAATHLLNFYGSPERAAFELGHSKDVLYRHYRAVVRKETSVAFFTILPDAAPAAVVNFPS